MNQNNIKTILQFMPNGQGYAFWQSLRGEEHEYFEDVANKIAQAINSALAIYETDGKEDVKPVLHYFWGNVDIYVTEIDRSEEHQHYGYISLGMGHLEGGYVDLDTIFRELPLINLDFNFTPKTIAEYKVQYEG